MEKVQGGGRKAILKKRREKSATLNVKEGAPGRGKGSRSMTLCCRPKTHGRRFASFGKKKRESATDILGVFFGGV